MNREFTFADWLVNNPSGYDHHDPANNAIYEDDYEDEEE